MKREKEKLKLKKKVTILFIEYFLFAAFSQIIYELICLILNTERFYPWYIRILSFFVYYTLCELKFNKSFGMYLFKVELDNLNEKKLNLKFVIYSIGSILDRTILVPIHLLLALLNYENLFVSEKLSGIKWKNAELN